MEGIQYVDKEVAFKPIYHGDAYKELQRLATEFSRTKVAGYRSKKWWDDEMSSRLGEVKRASP